MKVITSNAGHSKLSPGASGSGYKEHELARRINRMFIKACSNRGVLCINSTSNAASQSAVLEGQLTKANASQAEFAISHHVNSGGGTGFEVCYKSGNKRAQEIAEQISAALAEVYGLRDRGPKARNDLRWLNGTDMDAILIEWGFIDSRIDMKAITTDTRSGCLAILEALGHTKPYKLTRTLKRGDSGHDVKLLQQRLTVLGYKVGATGTFGYKTERMVAKFKKAHELSRVKEFGRKAAKAIGWRA